MLAMRSFDVEAPVTGDALITVVGATLVAHPAGALYWPELRLLIVSDLHLEKGSAYAARGALLPPYDTAATLARLALLVLQYNPRSIVALGDSFHDGDGPARLATPDRDAILGMQRGRDWIWITGNHDPAPHDLGGAVTDVMEIGPVSLRHQPTGLAGEIAGHLHPCARVTVRGRAMTRRCFATDGERLVMPAFGAYAGGLSVRDRAFAAVFAEGDFNVHLLGTRRIHTFTSTHCG